MSDSVEKQRARGRSATVVAIAIVLSRLAGLARQRVTAHFFGTSAVADVIAAAFRIGNLAQNLLGEGTLSASFIPVYARLRAEGKADEARRFAQAALGAVGIAVVLLSALGVALAPWLSVLVAGGFEADELRMTADLVRLLFPMTGLLVLCAWALGVLNVHRSFFLPYAAPVVWSAAQIAALAIGGSWLLLRGEALARALALGALAGATVELIWLFARARRFLGTLRPLFDLRMPAVREAARRLPAVILGRGVIQLSGLLDTLLVSFLGAGATATFAYAQMIYLLPMSVLGTGEAAVALPEMASDGGERNLDERNRRIRTSLADSLRRVVLLAVPTVVVLCLFGGELTALLLRTGKFDRESTARVAEALAVYGVALLGNASGRLFGTAFYALGAPRVPARFAVVRVVASTLVSLALMRPLGVVGVVLGAAFAAWLECSLLGGSLRREIDGLGLGALPWARFGVLALLTAGPPLALRFTLAERALEPLWALLVLCLAGGSFLAGALALRLADLRSLLRRR